MTNPALTTKTFSNLERVDAADAMTVQGTINKTAILLLLVLLPAGFVWRMHYAGTSPNLVSGLMMLGLFGGLILAFTTIWKKEWAPVTAPIYAMLEGLFIGGFSAMLDTSYPGIAIQAAGLTFGTLFAMLAAYSSGLIKATENFKLGIVAATGGIAIVYVVSLVLSLFHINVPFVYGNGAAGIAFSVFVVAIAALNLIIDFDFISQSAQRRIPKYMEWYGAFALMVTLIWLYIEILRLLAKVRGRE